MADGTAPLAARLDEDAKTALRAGEKLRLGVIRRARAAVKNAEIAAREAASKAPMTDPATGAAVDPNVARRRKENFVGGSRDVVFAGHAHFHVGVNRFSGRFEISDRLAQFKRLAPADGREIYVQQNGADALVNLSLSHLRHQAGEGLLLGYAKGFCKRLFGNIVRQIARNIENKNAVVSHVRLANRYGRDHNADYCDDKKQQKNAADKKPNFCFF